MNNEIDKGGEGEGDELDIDLGGEGEGEGDGKGDEGEGKDKKGESDGKSGKDKYKDETPEDRFARLSRITDQHAKKHKLGKYKDAAPSTDDKQPTAKTGELDYGQKAFLVSFGYKTSAEMKIAQDVMKSSGKTLEEVMEDGYFQNQIKDHREDKKSKDAVPPGSKRSGQMANDTVEYWTAKGELPPIEQTELRQKVVNAKMKAQGSGSPFTKNPVVGR
jgi:hypothetical protein